MGPKEDKKDKADRERERRLALIDRRESAEETASGLSSDIQSVYGIRGLSMFGTPGPTRSPITRKAAPVRTPNGR